MITLLVVSDGDKHFEGAINEYTKRLGKKLSVVVVKPSKKSSPSECIVQDTKNIIEYITHKQIKSTIVFLSKEWAQRTTQWWSQFLGESINQWESVLLIIGWPYWLDETLIKPYIHKNCSLWLITMPHWLAKLVVLEQIYRCNQIYEGRSYHY